MGDPQKWVGLQFSKAWLVDDPIRDSFLARCLAHIGDDHNHRKPAQRPGIQWNDRGIMNTALSMKHALQFFFNL